MSKANKRKSGGDTASKSSNSSSASKDSQKRPSVFERLGTKTPGGTAATSSLTVSTAGQPDFCRHWAQNGTCPYGKTCKLSSTHILISPSKRNAKKEAEQTKQGREEKSGRTSVHSTVVRKSSPEVNWESWDQTELEYEDEKALERRRQLLQRELELQMKKDTRKQDLAKRRSSSTSSCSSSSSSGSSSSGSSSTRSSPGAARKRAEPKKKRQSTSSPSSAERNKKTTAVTKMGYKESPSRKVSVSRKSGGGGGSSPVRKTSRRTPPPPPRKPPSPPKQKPPPPPPPASSSQYTQRLVQPGRAGSSSSRRKESPRGGRCSSKHRSPSRERERRGRTPTKPRHRSRGPRPKTNRPRSTDRKKDDDRGRKDDSGRRDRKSDFRDKRDQEELRRKERVEALERCRERQREREQLARERREAEARSKARKDTRDRYDKDKDKRSGGGGSGGGGGDHGSGGGGGGGERKGGGAERERSYDRGEAKGRKASPRERSRDRYDRPNYDRRIDDKPAYTASPYRGSERNRYDTERGDRDRVMYKEVTPSRDESRMRLSQSYQDDRRMRRERGWEGRYEEGSGKASREWDTRDYQDSRRDWDTRSRRGIEEGEGSEWGYSGGGGGGDWHRGGGRAEHNLVVIRDNTQEDRRGLHGEEKDQVVGEVHPIVDQVEVSKRGRESDGIEGEAKRPRLEEPPPAILEGELSDISDGPDEILNREDTEDTLMEEGPGEMCSEPVLAVGEPQQQDETSQPSTIMNIEQRLLESRMPEEEGIDNLDFEEISDEELEEEAKANKCSLGDALGVDWASLVAECRPQKRSQQQSAHTAWHPNNIFSRIGVSLQLAGPTLFNRIQESIQSEDKEEGKLLNGVAGVHRAMSERRQKRKALLSGAQIMPKRALSARADIYIRRQLCSLPAVGLESQPAVGFCQWVV